MTEKIKTLIVDDSAFARSIIVKRLGVDLDIEVIGVAEDGIDALEKIKQLKPNVVTMDITMPRMDGLTALERIMAECPTPVIMLSALTAEQAPATISALELGAVDFYLKPSTLNPAGMAKHSEELIQKIKIAAQVDLAKMRRNGRGSYRASMAKALANGSASKAGPSVEKGPPSNGSRYHGKVLVIGSSTGGPRALSELIPDLPADLPVPYCLSNTCHQGSPSRSRNGCTRIRRCLPYYDPRWAGHLTWPLQLACLPVSRNTCFASLTPAVLVK